MIQINLKNNEIKKILFINLLDEGVNFLSPTQASKRKKTSNSQEFE